MKQTKKATSSLKKTIEESNKKAAEANKKNEAKIQKNREKAKQIQKILVPDEIQKSKPAQVLKNAQHTIYQRK